MIEFKKACLFALLLITVLQSCHSTDKKVIKLPDPIDSVTKKSLGCSVDRAMNRLMKLEEVQAQNQLLDSMTKGKHGIAFLSDSTTFKGKSYYSFNVGYNNDLRFETYYNFYVDRSNCQEVLILEPISGDYISLHDWKLNNSKKVNIADINLPIESKEYAWTKMKYKTVRGEFQREKELEFSCGNDFFRYIPLGKVGETELVLVPMDCGDFDDYFSLLTIQNKMIVDNVHAEGLWYEPEGEPGDEEHTSFKLSANGHLEIINEIYVKDKLSKTVVDSYELQSDGKLKKL